jgi:hypothetical protein
MQVKSILLLSAAAIVLASCGEAGESSDNPDSTNASTTTRDETRTTRTVSVPEATRTSFEAKYPQASNVTWNYHEPAEVPTIDWDWTSWPVVDSNDMVARFSMNNEDYWVWYDESGNWIGTVSNVRDNASLPAAVNATVKSEFPGYTIVSIDKENDKNRTAYEIQLEKGEDKMKALIAENGQVIKKKGKVDGEKVKEKNSPED